MTRVDQFHLSNIVRDPCTSQARCSHSSFPHLASTRWQGNTGFPKLSAPQERERNEVQTNFGRAEIRQGQLVSDSINDAEKPNFMSSNLPSVNNIMYMT